MTVKELIEKLKEQKQDAEVWCNVDDISLNKIESVIADTFSVAKKDFVALRNF